MGDEAVDHMTYLKGMVFCKGGGQDILQADKGFPFWPKKIQKDVYDWCLDNKNLFGDRYLTCLDIFKRKFPVGSSFLQSLLLGPMFAPHIIISW